MESTMGFLFGIIYYRFRVKLGMTGCGIKK